MNMDIMQKHLSHVVEQINNGDKEVEFLTPFVGCPKDDMKYFIEAFTCKNVEISNGYFAFKYVAKVME